MGGGGERGRLRDVSKRCVGGYTLCLNNEKHMGRAYSFQSLPTPYVMISHPVEGYGLRAYTTCLGVCHACTYDSKFESRTD